MNITGLAEKHADKKAPPMWFGSCYLLHVATSTPAVPLEIEKLLLKLLWAELCVPEFLS